VPGKLGSPWADATEKALRQGEQIDGPILRPGQDEAPPE
jgi:hypothetical protein